MKAVVFHEFGGLDCLQLEEVPDPKPGPGEVLIDIGAAALNHLDVDVREGVSRFPVETPFVLGVEVVGRIAEVGEGVEGWETGDRVMPFLMDHCGDCRYCRTGRESLCDAAGFISFSTSGGYAEQLVCATGHLMRVPEELSDEAAAALQIAFGTAWHMLFTRGRLAPDRDGDDQLGRQRDRLGCRPARAPRRRDRDRQRELRREARPREPSSGWTTGSTTRRRTSSRR